MNVLNMARRVVGWVLGPFFRWRMRRLIRQLNHSLYQERQRALGARVVSRAEGRAVRLARLRRACMEWFMLGTGKTKRRRLRARGRRRAWSREHGPW